MPEAILEIRTEEELVALRIALDCLLQEPGGKKEERVVQNLVVRLEPTEGLTLHRDGLRTCFTTLMGMRPRTRVNDPGLPTGYLGMLERIADLLEQLGDPVFEDLAVGDVVDLLQSNLTAIDFDPADFPAAHILFTILEFQSDMEWVLATDLLRLVRGEFE